MKIGWGLFAVAAVAASACAEAGSSTDAAAGDDDVDAAIGGQPDAAAGQPDAAASTPDADVPPIDATPPPPDAPTLGCGDGVITAPETCDDGTVPPVSGDGCSDTCAVEPYSKCTGEPSTCAPIKILYAPSEADDAVYRAAIGAITGGAVDYADAIAATPDAATLAGYDCIYTWANQAYNNPTLYGDNLADFVDAGGVVVLGVFTTYTSGNSMAGRIMTTGYSPVISPLGGNHFLTSTYAGDGATFLHNAVTTYECQYRDTLTLQGTGVTDGTYADAEIGHAYRPDLRVVYSNGSGASQLGCTGDWARLVANACAAAHLP
jgi:cysteine-rich repeat protein